MVADVQKQPFHFFYKRMYCPGTQLFTVAVGSEALGSNGAAKALRHTETKPPAARGSRGGGGGGGGGG